MVEIEIGVLRGQCLDRRIENRKALESPDRRLGGAAQRRRRAHQMDVHHSARAHQTTARLSRPS
jgi:hypothetical protein